LTKAAALEYASRGIRINAIGPGAVRTPLTAAFLDDEQFRHVFNNANALGRPAEPEEMVGRVLHLSSAEASFTSGQLFLIDGGQTAR
jgi:NAD(P)-dependent dehydrogenase (short-subunit alcohol dehydrogenase family)